jgi:hypothetical protein
MEACLPCAHLGAQRPRFEDYAACKAARLDCGNPDPPDWLITLRGDLLIALRNFDCNRYWHGEITLPLQVVK